MRRRVLLLLLPLIWLTPSCATGPLSEDPAIRQLQIGTELLLRIEELQATIIDLNERGALDDPTAIRLVRFTDGAARTIHAAPQGWAPTFRAAYNTVRTELLGVESISPFVPIIDAILQQLVPHAMEVRPCHSPPSWAPCLATRL